jgi:hypothetical protein
MLKEALLRMMILNDKKDSDNENGNDYKDRGVQGENEERIMDTSLGGTTVGGNMDSTKDEEHGKQVIYIDTTHKENLENRKNMTNKGQNDIDGETTPKKSRVMAIDNWSSGSG